MWRANRISSRYNIELSKKHSSARRLSSQELVSDLKGPFPAKLHQASLESKWNSFWTGQRLSSSIESADSNQCFSMILPPPNVTGTLHLGHALTVSIQDAIIRLNRMQGTETLWIPGFDHAGIATQAVLDKHLLQKLNKTRFELDRRSFEVEASEWTSARITQMRNQIKRLGVSLDYDKEYFTLDQRHSFAVNEAFIRLFDAGHIYRANRPVNWCYKLKSTISDIEVDYLKLKGPTKVSLPDRKVPIEFGVIHSIAFPLDDGSGDVTIATTRIETLPGDTAVAVNPNDERYAHLLNSKKRVRHPLTGKVIPIIADDSVDPQMGTGALKVTPAHDQLDYQLGIRHNLEIVTVFDSSGRISCETLAELNGVDRLDAKHLIRKHLESSGHYRGAVEHETSLPICSRTGDLVETIILPQWYLRSESVRQEVIDHVASDELHVHPTGYKNTLLMWLNRNANRDWCISRQLWWGHQIPVYAATTRYSSPHDGTKPFNWVAAHNEERAKEIYAQRENLPRDSVLLNRDADVLDTWFSSALLPLSLAGWPKVDVRQAQHFPLSLMETGFDIIYFWAARMVLISKLLTGELPFRNILLHGMVCDKDGKKMSKSVGNVIDPLDVMEGSDRKWLKLPPCGADGLRMSLLEQDFKKEVIRMSPQQIVAWRNFTNKMFNSVKYLSSNLDKLSTGFVHQKDFSAENLSAMDKWILSSLSRTVSKCISSAKSPAYDLHHSIHAIRKFWVEDLCDFYLEWTKHHFEDPIHERRERANLSANILLLCFRTSLNALHPFAPHITEELYQRIHFKLNPDSTQIESLANSSYLCNEKDLIPLRDRQVETSMQVVCRLITALKGFQADFVAKDEQTRVLLIHNVLDDKNLLISLLDSCLPLFLKGFHCDIYRYKSLDGARGKSSYDRKEFVLLDEFPVDSQLGSSLLVLVAADEAQRHALREKVDIKVAILTSRIAKWQQNARLAQHIASEEETRDKLVALSKSLAA